MAKEHVYRLAVAWTGNRGTGTSGYTAYGREHEMRAEGKPPLPGSSDPAFRGDPARWNPEELLVASLSTCHMLWYLHLCADAGVVVTDYVDRAEGIMIEPKAGVAKFERVILRPLVTLAPGADRRAGAGAARAGAQALLYRQLGQLRGRARAGVRQRLTAGCIVRCCHDRSRLSLPVTVALTTDRMFDRRIRQAA